MGLFSWLFRRVPKLSTITDDELGCIDSYDREMWHAEITVLKPKRRIVVLLHGDEHGPSARSRAGVAKLRERWSTLIAEDVAERVCAVWTEDEDPAETAVTPKSIWYLYRVDYAQFRFTANGMSGEVGVVDRDDRWAIIEVRIVDWAVSEHEPVHVAVEDR